MFHCIQSSWLNIKFTDRKLEQRTKSTWLHTTWKVFSCGLVKQYQPSIGKTRTDGQDFFSTWSNNYMLAWNPEHCLDISFEECNLMDSIELPQILFSETLLSEIRKLRRNPISSAAIFLDSTRCFRHSHLQNIRSYSGVCVDLIWSKNTNIEKAVNIFLAEDDDWNGLNQRGCIMEKRSSAQNFCQMVPSKQPWESISHHGSAWPEKWLYSTLFTWIFCMDSMFQTMSYWNMLTGNGQPKLFASSQCCYSMKPLKRGGSQGTRLNIHSISKLSSCSRRGNQL